MKSSFLLGSMSYQQIVKTLQEMVDDKFGKKNIIDINVQNFHCGVVNVPQEKRMTDLVDFVVNGTNNSGDGWIRVSQSIEIRLLTLNSF